MERTTTWLPGFSSLLVVAMFLGAGLLFTTPAAAGNSKVVICHIPPGDPEEAHTITVSEKALQAHLKHGDWLGECASECLGDAECDDQDLCTDDECLSNGECSHVTVDCDDGNVCTDDLCNDPTVGCENPPVSVSTECDDNNACTSADTCEAGICTGTDIAGCCLDVSECDDEDWCTDDACEGNVCAYSPVDCSIPDDQCFVGSCDSFASMCVAVNVSCDDLDVCTDDFCDSGTGCYSEPAATPPEPGIELTCDDDVDNDCDGLVDADDSDCEPACVPSDEICDGIDNDCDGDVDEGFENVGEMCFDECLIEDLPCVIQCDVFQLETFCGPVPPFWGCDPNNLQQDLCDYLDNDCDGVVDGGFDDLFEECSTGVGECETTGLILCSSDGATTECSAVTGVPPEDPEVTCDDLDNDCDGEVDEGFGLGATCTSGVGECQESGTIVCAADGTETECSAMEGVPPEDPEVTCDDGLDNDCDGLVDGDDADCEPGIPPRGTYSFFKQPTNANEVYVVEFHPDASYAALLERLNVVHIYHWATQTIETFDLTPTEGSIYWEDIAFDPDGDAAILVGRQITLTGGNTGVVYRLNDEAWRQFLSGSTGASVFEPVPSATGTHPYVAVTFGWGPGGNPLILERTSNTTFTVREFDIQTDSFDGLTTASNSFAGCDDLAIVNDGFGIAGILVVCGTNGSDAGFYTGDWMTVSSASFGSLSRVDAHPSRDYALAVSYSSGQLLRFQDYILNTSATLTSAWGVKFQDSGERALIVGRAIGAPLRAVVIEYRNGAADCVSFPSDCELTDVSIQNFDEIPYYGSLGSYLWDAAFRPGCDGGLIVGGETYSGGSVAQIIEFQIDGQTLCR